MVCWSALRVEYVIATAAVRFVLVQSTLWSLYKRRLRPGCPLYKPVQSFGTAVAVRGVAPVAAVLPVLATINSTYRHRVTATVCPCVFIYLNMYDKLVQA